MSTLVIVESPAKAKTIKKYLGPGYTVKASVGHVRDLPKNNKDAIDIENGFKPRYTNSPAKLKVIQELQTAATKADEILLAPDPDREGEAIAWHIAELLKKYNKNYKRISFNEITKDAVQEAIKKPHSIDMHLKEAQEARRVLDRLVGYDLSGLIWKKVRYGLSAGRVQSPALRIIMEREREIRAFNPVDFWIITADTTSPNKTKITFTCTEEPTDKKEADRIIKLGEKNNWKIISIKETDQKREPRPPFTTSTLQQTASNRLGFAPSRTMGAAQKLYEAGHITYMRTDSTNMSKVAYTQILKIVEADFGKKYVQQRTFKTKSKSAQEAHEAVRPSDFHKRSAGLTGDQKALYELIWNRAVASQMAPAVAKRTKIITNIVDSKETIPDFFVRGSRIIFDGWLRVDEKARSEDIEVPELSEGDTLTVKKLEAEAKQTQPPNRYSEAGLIKELEKRGIGRPSTYASTIKTIIDRTYVEKEGKTLIPTDLGDVVSSFLEEHFAEYISDGFTSEMEDTLDKIAGGTAEYVKVLTDFYGPFTKAVASKEDIDKLTDLGSGPKEFPCPLCTKGMVIKLGRGGKFLSCETFPECLGARMIDGSQIKPDEPLGKHPETGEDIFLLTGRFGPYVQLGPTPEKVKGKKAIMPKRASVPKEMKVEDVTLTDAVKYLILPREVGVHPDTGEPIVANTGKFGPYIVHAGDFRSLKGEDNPYDVTFDRTVEILKEPKKLRAGEKLVKEVGLHPKTKNMIKVFESKSGKYLKKGFKRLWLPDDIDMKKFTVEDALEIYKT